MHNSLVDFWLVLTFDILEDRRIGDVMNNFLILLLYKTDSKQTEGKNSRINQSEDEERIAVKLKFKFQFNE